MAALTTVFLLFAKHRNCMFLKAERNDTAVEWSAWEPSARVVVRGCRNAEVDEHDAPRCILYLKNV
jgi:hypothetical protein